MRVEESVERTPWLRTAALGVGLAAIICVVLLAFLWPAVTAAPKHLPIGLVGAPAATAQLEQALAERTDGAMDAQSFSDRDAAVTAIQTRAIYGSIVLGPQPEILTASAASPAVAQLLSGLAPALQAQLSAATAAQGAPPAVQPTVVVTDVVPLADGDRNGVVLAASAFPLVIGGLIGGIVASIAVAGVWRRLVALGGYAIVAGLAITGILQGWFGALQGSFLMNACAVALALLAVGAAVVGLVSLLGRAGIAVSVILIALIANPISAAALPVEFLAEPWGAVGQWFPPGAGATLLRDLSYFPAAYALFPWLVLGAWAAVGVVLAAVGPFRDPGATAANGGRGPAAG